MNTTLYDGYDPTAPHRHGPVRMWTDQTTLSLRYAQTLRVPWPFFAPSNFTTNGFNGGYLVGETEPRHIGAGLVEWDQSFALVPTTRTVPESIAYPVQLRTSTGDLVEIPIGTLAQVKYEYFYDPAGTAVSVLQTYRQTKVGTSFYFVGVAPSGPQFIAQDSKIRRWAGFITERATPYVTTASLTKEADPPSS